MVGKLKTWYNRMIRPNYFALDHLSRKLKSPWKARAFYLWYQVRKRIHHIRINRMKKNPDFHVAVDAIESALTKEHPLILIYKKYLPTMDTKKKQGVFRRIS